MPLTLIALSKVDDKDAGLASSLVNTCHVVGGSIGLAILGTLAWTVVANTARSSVNAARAGHPLHATAAQIKAAQAVLDGIVHIPPELAYGMAVSNVLAEVLFSAQNGQTRPAPPSPAYRNTWPEGTAAAHHQRYPQDPRRRARPQMTSGLDKASAVIITTLLGHLAAP